jgi:agmatine/peptidylarginine deiminase
MKKSFPYIAAAVAAVLLGATFCSAADLRLNAANAQSSPEVPAPAGLDNMFPSSPDVPSQGYTPSERKSMAGHNSSLGMSDAKSLYLKTLEGQYRPFADYQKTGFLIMSADFNFESGPAKLAMAKSLPADATLVIFSGSADAAAKERVLKAYETVLPRSRIKTIVLPGASSGFWARDCIPVPVFTQGGKLTVVDALYGHRFEPDAEIARLFNAGLEKHKYYFEGGNFQTNHSGDCMMVDHGAHIKIPDDIFMALYGCRQMIRLPFVDGIGHVDEHARFISEKVIVTDLPQYKDLLQGKGFTVHLLPRPSGAISRQKGIVLSSAEDTPVKAATGPYETYVNSLIMDGTVIVPVYGRPTDEQALDMYRGLGLKAVGAPSNTLSNKGQGSVHCITMTYPKMPAPELMKSLGAREY